MNVDKNKLKSMVKEATYDIQELKQNYGLINDSVWYEAFDAAPRETYNI